MTLLKEEKDCGINCCHTSIRQSNNSIADGDVESPLQVQQNVSLCENLIDSIDMNLPRSKEVDIEFQNIRYTIRRFSFAERKFVSKEILHGVNGNFRSGELTAIMGPSGSGKSSLLNVMTGFKSTGVTGTVQVNGIKQSTCSDSYRKLSCYIHQNDLLRPMLKVEETMMLAAHLKLGYKISNEFKRNLVKKILQLLGLDHRCNVYACKLSGGQKKRLAIALELISNPPVLYLDEPTTGLDSSSCVQCVSLLKKLAQHGHTIVCTIHQPSALIFELFDKLYGIVEGNCIYQGPVRELVPFLADQDLMCPSYHNPADYFMEVAVGDHDSDLTKLINAANKKYYEDSDLTQLNRVSRLITTIQENIEAKTSLISPLQPAFDYIKPDPMELSAPGTHRRENHELEIFMETASFAMQYFLLLKRIVVCARRNYFLLIARIASHVIIGALFGYLYLNVGDKATTVLGNYVYLYGTILLLVYTGKMAVVLSFPLEIGMLSREHFNRWYGLAPYFLSTISFEIPFQGFCAYLYIAISYYLTGNDSGENFRFYYFVLLGVMATLSAQAWGFFIGAVLPIKIAVFIGPILAVLFSVFGFCTRYIDITPLFRWMWHLSYFRAAFHGSLNAVYGMDRELLICPDTTIYCHFKSPKVFLNYMMISDVNMSDCICLMAAVITTMHCLTVVALWHKLTKR